MRSFLSFLSLLSFLGCCGRVHWRFFGPGYSEWFVLVTAEPSAQAAKDRPCVPKLSILFERVRGLGSHRGQNPTNHSFWMFLGTFFPLPL